MHAAPASGPFRAGERVQLTDPKGRLTTIWLESGKQMHSHQGTIAHDELIGLADGSVIASSEGTQYLALRPLLTDVIMSMPRGAAIIYPKDAAMILAKADIRPGARVVEAGVGSGALSLWILRMLGGTGSLKSFERRPEFADVARGNVVSVTGAEPENWEIVLGDLQDALPGACEPGSVDRVVLDMLAPWECLPAISDALVPGGVLLCYVATATQLSRVAEEIRASGNYSEPDAEETMVRGWHVQGLAVRPDHRMVAHTGFLISARRLAPNTVLPAKQVRGSKTPASLADTEAWTPSDDAAWTSAALGERQVSDRVLRKRGREATNGAERTRAAASGDIMDSGSQQPTEHNEGKATE
ncbi:MAG: tRNA (adenine-N1)-methyltransferase [Gulosibacter sp.]|uniref:tRNA (adenine-N1)-methyltransferase n=1 Tax=Gulosibacter sp. TaxID=2817531 RepID=UPI003F8F9270